MISVFSYTNYRVFLKEKYHEMKEEKSSFSYRFFSKECGYSSPNFLKLVIDGKRNLSKDSVEKFSKFFKFNKEETHFFSNLVDFDQAKSSEEKRELIKPILESSVFQRLNPISRDQYELFSKWYHLAILESLNLAGLRSTVSEISSLLSPKVTKIETQNAIDSLLRLGLIKKKGNRFVPSHELISTGDEVFNSLAIFEHHSEMLKLADKSMNDISGELRDISGVTVSLSEQGVDELKLMIKKFRKEILQLSEREQHKDRVYQVSLQMFPLTKVSND